MLIVEIWHLMIITKLTLVIAAVSCTGCGSSQAKPVPSTGPLQIVATTGMVADMVRSVAGDRCKVTALIGSGVDPHLYKPTRADVKRLLIADAVFYSGLHLEGRMTEAFTNLERGGKTVVALADSLPQDLLLHPADEDGHWDPHVWMDVSLWSRCLPSIEQSLINLLPEYAADFRQRTASAQEQLAELDTRIETAIQSIPRDQRVLITAHDAFGYFSRRYGIEVRAIQGVSTESEAGVGDINQLVSFIVKHQIPAVFVESSVNSKTVQAAQEGAAARGFQVRIGAELYSDAMGSPGTYEGTYLGMMDANATRITQALGGRVEASGLFGMLQKQDEK